MERLKLFFANVYLVRQPEPVLIDTGAPGDEGRILKWLAKQGVQPRDLKLIVLTHAHFDHAGSVAALKAATNAPVAVHRADVAMLESGKIPPMLPMDVEGYFVRPLIKAHFSPTSPDLVVEDGFDFAAHGLEATWIHTPGHTDGSITLLLPSGAALAGDILRGGLFGGNLVPQIPRQPFYMHDKAQFPTLLASIQRVLDAGAQSLHIGHGGPLQRDAVAKWLAKQQAAQR